MGKYSLLKQANPERVFQALHLHWFFFVKTFRIEIVKLDAMHSWSGFHSCNVNVSGNLQIQLKIISILQIEKFTHAQYHTHFQTLLFVTLIRNNDWIILLNLILTYFIVIFQISKR